ncbi:MAG: signal peptidase II [Candidatus Gracilibacteria bacterium]
MEKSRYANNMLKKPCSYLVLTSLSLLILWTDLFTKHVAETVFSVQPVTLFPGVEFIYSKNTGIAFGLPVGGVFLLVLTALLMVGFLVYALRQLDLRRCSVTIMISLVLGGALGNFIDRFSLGFVRDFIRIGPWPTFNIADSALCIGLFLLFLSLIFPPHDVPSRRGKFGCDNSHGNTRNGHCE